MSTSRDSAPDVTPPASAPSDPVRPRAQNPAGAPAVPPDPAVIRIPATAYFPIVVLLAILSMPVLAWPLQTGWLLLVPVALCWWVARVRTTVTADEIRVRTAIGSRSIPWGQVKGVYFPTPKVFGISWARAVLVDESRVALPAVTWQQIPELSRASGGKFPDVTAPPPAPAAPADPPADAE